MDLYIIRHGDPDYDNDTLTEYGWRQAKILGKRLSAEGIDYIYSSPMGRAKNTATPLAELLDKPIIIQPWAREIGVPCWTPNQFLLSDECMEKGFRWFETERFKDIPMAEVSAAIHSGLDAMLAFHGYERRGDKYIPYAPNNDKVALFCHGNMAATMIPHLFNIPINKVWAQTVLYTTSITIFHFTDNPEGALPVCKMLNERSHLKKLPDPNFDKIPQV